MENAGNSSCMLVPRNDSQAKGTIVPIMIGNINKRMTRQSVAPPKAKFSNAEMASGAIAMERNLH